MKDIDDIYLPLGSDNENIESISRKKFIQLFDEKRFILKDEFVDNGIDFRFEIVKEFHKLGFGFNFQLKAKIEAGSNLDGSYSKSLETSNIEYLLNNGQPAFYGFYVQNEDKIYYEDLHLFINSLNKKSPNWENQPNHTLRFSKVLDEAAVDKIYENAYNHGKLLRSINFRLAVESATSEYSNSISIDFNKNVTDDNAIRQMIEAVGLDLINETRWGEIIQVHKKASGNVAITAKYNLILGIANYYSGNIIDAIAFFKSSTKKIDELSDYLKKHLKYFDIISRYAVGMISKDEYNAGIKEFEDTDNIKFYVQLEQAKIDFISNVEVNEEDSYQLFFNTVQKIIDNPEANDNIKLLARVEFVYIEGHKNNLNYVRDISRINAIEGEIGYNSDLRIRSMLKFMDEQKLWFKYSLDLRDEAFKNKNFIVYYNTIVNEIKIKYEFYVYADILRLVAKGPVESAQEMPDKKEHLIAMISVLNKSHIYYQMIGHIENVISVLSTKYELYHYLEDFQASHEILNELENIVSTIDSTEIKRKFLFLKQSGTTHERFKDFIDTIFDKADLKSQEIKKLISEMETMDKEDISKIVEDSGDKYLHINVFPIGFFAFPESLMDEVLSILKIDNSVVDIFKDFFKDRIIPVANIYDEIVLDEGYGKGHLSNRGIESLRNIYRVRKSFFEREIFRVDLQV